MASDPSLATSGDSLVSIGASGFPPYPLPYHPYTAPAFLQAWQRVRDENYVRKFFVEFVCSFAFCFLVIMPAGGFILTKQVAGSFLITILCLFLSVMFTFIIAAPHTGGLLTPAITITMAIFRGVPWKVVPLYIVAQFLGAFFAGVLSYAILAPWLDVVDGGNRNLIPLGPGSTAAIFLSMPQEFLPIGHLFLNELVGDAVFMFIVFGVADSRNPLSSIKHLPYFIGLAVFLSVCAFGWYGLVLNPFRDFGPRVYLSHYYNGLFTHHDHYSMIALWVPFLGHFLGAALYDFFVSSRYPAEGKRQVSTSSAAVHIDNSL